MMTLSVKHQEFIAWYLQLWNQTAAYQRVYPKSSAGAARAHAARLVANGNVREEIERRIAEHAMSTAEVLMRLAEQARGDIGDFLTVAPGGAVELDLSKAADKIHLIRRVRQRRTTRTTKEGVIDKTVWTLELYDAQAALIHIGKQHKLFTDRVERDATDWIVRVQYGDEKAEELRVK